MAEPARIPAGQIFHRYLPRTQNWIYQQLSALQRYRPAILAFRAVHLDEFGIEPAVFIRGGSVVRRAYDRLGSALLGYSPVFARFARPQQLRVLHAHFGETGVTAVGLARELRLPLLTSFYGVDLWRDFGDPARLRRLYAPLFDTCTFALAEGRAARHRLIELGCPAEKAQIHRLGIDLSRIEVRTRSARERVRVLMAARFTEKKGLPYGVEAFCRAAREIDSLELTVVGDAGRGANEQAIKRQLHDTVQRYELADRVAFTGSIRPEQLRALLYDHDLLLQPSVRAANGDAEGGLPVILLEAAAAGMPLVASNHCDIPEIVIDGVTGWLCGERDVDALAQALLNAARDANARAERGLQARAVVEEKFHLRRQTLDAVYDAALGRRE